jgi:hypothetical protein
MFDRKKSPEQSIEKNIYNVLIRIKEQFTELKDASYVKNAEEELHSSYNAMQETMQSVLRIISQIKSKDEKWWTKYVIKPLERAYKSKDIYIKEKQIDFIIHNLEPYINSKKK